MKQYKKRSFKDLVLENKRQLLNDKKALEKIEDRLDKRAQDRLF